MQFSTKFKIKHFIWPNLIGTSIDVPIGTTRDVPLPNLDRYAAIFTILTRWLYQTIQYYTQTSLFLDVRTHVLITECP